MRDNKEALSKSEEPTGEELEHYLDGVTQLVPTMTRERLSKRFGMMDHNGNSRTDFMLEQKIVTAENGAESGEVKDEFEEIHEGGRCVYDPYFLHGFARFGEIEIEDMFGDHDNDGNSPHLAELSELEDIDEDDLDKEFSTEHHEKETELEGLEGEDDFD